MGYSAESIEDHCRALREESRRCSDAQTSVMLGDAAILVEDLYKEIQMAKAAATLNKEAKDDSRLVALQIENDM